jgi:hypothetical protein
VSTHYSEKEKMLTIPELGIEETQISLILKVSERQKLQA